MDKNPEVQHPQPTDDLSRCCLERDALRAEVKRMRTDIDTALRHLSNGIEDFESCKDGLSFLREAQFFGRRALDGGKP